MHHPDVIPPVSTLGEIESRMGIPPLETLLAERDELVKQVAPLRAKHGPWGCYGDERKIELAKVAAMLRSQAVVENRKVTEASLEEASHAHPTYVGFVTTATEEKARYFELENRIEGIGELIQRGNVIARYLSSEIALSR